MHRSVYIPEITMTSQLGVQAYIGPLLLVTNKVLVLFPLRSPTYLLSSQLFRHKLRPKDNTKSQYFFIGRLCHVGNGMNLPDKSFLRYGHCVILSHSKCRNQIRTYEGSDYDRRILRRSRMLIPRLWSYGRTRTFQSPQ